jgi:beta propeller repeat protein
MTFTKNAVIFAFIILATIFCFTAPVLAAPLSGTMTKISVGIPSAHHLEPSISGNYIVWRDDRTGNKQIYLYNIATGIEQQITQGTEFHYEPAVAGNVVVWEDNKFTGLGYDYDIALYFINNGTTVRITNRTGTQQKPSTDGSLIAWEDNRNAGTTGWDIYAYNLSSGSEFCVTNAAGTQELPRVSNDVVVWQDSNDIYMYDWTGTKNYAGDNTPFLVVQDPNGYDQVNPSIKGSRLVWSEYQDWTNYWIYLQDILTGDVQLITPDGNDHTYPDVDGTRVVWLESDQVYLNDTAVSSSETPVTANGNTKDGIRISADRIVWHELNPAVSSDEIYMFTIGTAETCPVADFTISPSKTGALPLTVQFTNTSTPGTRGISYWRWEFGDGNTSTLENPGFTYNIAGNYDVRLTVNNPYCRNETPVSNSYKISVGAAPVASFITNVSSGIIPMPVAFNDTSVAAGAWNWSFGDGSYSDQQNVTHSYAVGGTYTAVLNASNTYGYALAQKTIQALNGVTENAVTTNANMTFTTQSGRQFLSFNTTNLPGGFVYSGSVLISRDANLSVQGWQNITFIADSVGFHQFDNGTVMGNLTGVTLQTKDIHPTGFNKSTGESSSVNFSVTLDSYPTLASLNTQVWEGVLDSDLTPFRSIAQGGGWSHVLRTAYTTKVTKTNFSSSGSARIHMSVNSTWVADNEGRDHTFIIRISDDRSTGEVLPTRFLYDDPITNLDYFEADSPNGLSTFGLSQLAGSGNVLQAVSLSIASRISSGDAVSGDDSGFSGQGTGTGKSSQPVAVQNPNVPGPPAPVDPGKTAALYTNANGVITQATTLQSTDNMATVVIGEGIVAKDSSGHPLSSISLAADPEEHFPSTQKDLAHSFSGLAYELQPEGATFSPAISLTFTYPQAKWGEEYSIKALDHTTDTWQDLPTQYNPETGKITAQVSHFCCFALFSKSPVREAQVSTPAHPVVTEQQLTLPPPTNAVSIFLNMAVWLAGFVKKNVLVLAIAVIPVVIVTLLAYKNNRKKRMDRIRYKF